MLREALVKEAVISTANWTKRTKVTNMEKNNQTNKGEHGVIRAIEHHEIKDCVALIKNSFLPVADKYGITVKNAPRYTAFSVCDAELNKRLCGGEQLLGYFDQGNLVGYYSLNVMDKMAEINHLCVDPGRQKQGIGTLLVSDAVQRAKALGCSAVNISIVAENKPLCHWYQKQGFIWLYSKKYNFFPFTCGYLQKRM